MQKCRQRISGPLLDRIDLHLEVPRLIKKHCELDVEGAAFLEHQMGELNFSARAHDRILKVARTLADLKGLDRIDADSVLEAVNYRTLDRDLWSFQEWRCLP